MRRSLFPERNVKHQADKRAAEKRPESVPGNEDAYGAQKASGETEADLGTRPPDEEVVALLRRLVENQGKILDLLGELNCQVHDLGVKMSGAYQAGGSAHLDDDIPF